jgi:2',3'-cyclic-nucleotide 2'-phosphodiesterase (5'-nucleotidase family)
MLTLNILHTNDFHNHLTAPQAQILQKAKASLQNVLLLDAGDAVSAGNLGVRPGGEPILTLMSETGYDAMALGNREFHIADALLRCKINRASFPILCANMGWKEDTGDSLPVIAHFIRTMPNGLRVAVFGLTVPMVTPRMAARAVSAFLFDDPIQAARQQIAILKPQADVLIALTHIGLRRDEELAAACPELDLIIGGHSHNVLPEPRLVGAVPIVQGGWYGHYWGNITLDIGEDGHRRSIMGKLEALTA